MKRWMVGEEQSTNLLERAKKSYEAQKRPFPKPGTAAYNTLQGQAVTFLLQRAEFIGLSRLLMKLLAPYPEARAAVAAGLADLAPEAESEPPPSEPSPSPSEPGA